MAVQMTERLDNLYVVAVDRDAPLMHANAVSACARWCGPKTTPTQVQDFVQRQISSLELLNDSLSTEIRASWQWLAGQLGPTPVAVPEHARSLRFAGGRDQASPAPGRVGVAA